MDLGFKIPILILVAVLTLVQGLDALLVALGVIFELGLLDLGIPQFLFLFRKQSLKIPYLGDE